MDGSSQPGTIHTFRDFPHLETRCKICDAHTLIAFGVITGGCDHIGVVWCDDYPAAADA